MAKEYPDIDLTHDILSLASPLVSKVDELKVVRADEKEQLTDRDQHYLVICSKDDIGKLIGRHGVISDSLRTLLNVSIKNMHKKVHLKFLTQEEYQKN